MPKGITYTPWQQRIVDVVAAVLAEADSSRPWEHRLPGAPDRGEVARNVGEAKVDAIGPVMGQTTVALELVRMICRWDPSLARKEVRRALLAQLAGESL